MNKLFLRITAIAIGVLAPATLLAATVDFSGGITVPMGKNYTAQGQTTSVVFNGSTLDVTLAASESITLTSPDNTKFTHTSSGLTTSDSCTATSYVFTWSNPSGGSTQTFTITPSASTCVVSGGGGSAGGSGGAGGGGGGGGGGGNASSLTTPPTATPPPPPTTTPPPTAGTGVAFAITSDLSKGSEGTQVSQLQAYLAGDPAIYPEGKITGYFGALTEQAVKRFQAKYGITQLGRVGPATRAKLAELFGGTTTPAPASSPAGTPSGGAITQELSRGSTGADVTTLQTYLAGDPELYPEGLVTGYFGSATERAVRRFQAKYGIAQVGRVGPMTMAKLNELLGGSSTPPPASSTPPPASTQSAEDAAKIKLLQDQLKALNDQLKALGGQ